MNDLWSKILFWCILVIGSMILIHFLTKDYQQPKRRSKRQHDPYTNATLHATVVDQRCNAQTRKFTIVFQTDDGTLLRRSIPEDMYDGFEVGQTGLLSIVDGDVYTFELDEGEDCNETYYS